MIERRSQPRLAQEALPETHVLRQFGGEQLQRDISVEREITRAINHPHPARPSNDSIR
jgi:hypothetical protein